MIITFQTFLFILLCDWITYRLIFTWNFTRECYKSGKFTDHLFLIQKAGNNIIPLHYEKIRGLHYSLRKFFQKKKRNRLVLWTSYVINNAACFNENFMENYVEIGFFDIRE